MEILNGTGKPRIQITFTDSSTATINLPYARNNLQERIEELRNLHTMIDKSTEIDRLGFHWACTISYRKLMKGLEYQTLSPLFRNDIDTIYVTPRVDVPARKFLVYLANRIQVERAAAQGHSGIELQFDGMVAETGIIMTDVIGAQPVINADNVIHIEDNNTIPVAGYE